MDMATSAHRGLGCRGVSRTDFRWDDDQGSGNPGGGLKFFFPARDPIPARMTPTFLTPETGAHADSFGALCRGLGDAIIDR